MTTEDLVKTFFGLVDSKGWVDCLSVYTTDPTDQFVSYNLDIECVSPVVLSESINSNSVQKAIEFCKKSELDKTQEMIEMEIELIPVLVIPESALVGIDVDTLKEFSIMPDLVIYVFKIIEKAPLLERLEDYLFLLEDSSLE